MADIKPSILLNPNYATNGLSSDTKQAGFYQVTPNTSNLALRVNYTNIGLGGEIRLNTTTTPAKFQGNNGSVWVDFNATQGNIGLPGKDFTNAVNFNNLASSPSISTGVTLASIFATTYVNVDQNISNVNIRSLKGGQYEVNSNLSIGSMSLSQNSNVITLTPNPLPYTYSFAGGEFNTIKYLKNSPTDSQNFSWGESSFWTVKKNAIVKKGQAVRITDDLNSSNVVITPINYTSLSGVNPFNTPFNMLGIALNDANDGAICRVCTKGMTTVLCTSNIASGFSPIIDIPFVGADGIVGKDGGIFCSSQDPTVNYIRAGYFLESGTGKASNENYALFYVDSKVQSG